jgi:hypothetical protein
MAAAVRCIVGSAALERSNELLPTTPAARKAECLSHIDHDGRPLLLLHCTGANCCVAQY